MANQTVRSVRIPRKCRPQVNPAHAVYEVDLWLVDSDPLIWRTLAVPAEFTLDQLHRLIQCAMQWEDCHLHQFETQAGRRFEPKRQVGGVDAMWRLMSGEDGRGEAEAPVTLRDLFDELRQAIAYVYDFGDGWTHGVKLVDTHEGPAGLAHLPICLAGERAGPPEDSGGVWGYQEKLEILRNPDPDDEWHQEVIEWMGGVAYNPDHFDPDAHNRLIKRAWRQPARSAGSSSQSHGKKRRERRSR